MTKQEHQALDESIPKCKCGNNLSRDRQAEGINHCPSCDIAADSRTALLMEIKEWISEGGFIDGTHYDEATIISLINEVIVEARQ